MVVSVPPLDTIGVEPSHVYDLVGSSDLHRPVDEYSSEGQATWHIFVITGLPLPLFRFENDQLHKFCILSLGLVPHTG